MSVRRQQACGRRRALLRTLLRTLFPVFRPSLRLLVARGLRRRFTGGGRGGWLGWPPFGRSAFFSASARTLLPRPPAPARGFCWRCFVRFCMPEAAWAWLGAVL